ncbi:MAG: CRISPR-associated DxTHG motif protein, partial [Planctomycetota bacterium]
MRILLSTIGLGSPIKDTNGKIVDWAYKPTTYFCNPPYQPVKEAANYHQPILFQGIEAEELWLVGTVDAKKWHAPRIRHDRFIDIPKGMDDAEFWQMFNAITTAMDDLRRLHTGADAPPHEIHLDLTHGFRVQPVFLLEAVRYACQLWPKHLRLAEVHYSFYEHDDTTTPLRMVTPVLDMASIAYDVRTFLENGAGEPLARHLDQLARKANDQARERAAQRQIAGDQRSLGAIINEERNQDQATGLPVITGKLQSFANLVRLANAPAAAAVTQGLLHTIEESREKLQGSLRPLGEALSALADQLRPHLPKDPSPVWPWHAALARWCLDRGLLQQALTHGEEITTTRICETCNIDVCDKNIRGAISQKFLHTALAENWKPWVDAVRYVKDLR